MLRSLSLSLAALCLFAYLMFMVACRSLQSEPAPPPQRPPQPLDSQNQCQFLQVGVSTPSGGSINVPYQEIDCKHGYFQSMTPPNGYGVSQVVVKQSTFYGPNCTITFNVVTESGANVYKIQVQQDFCSTEYGNVSYDVLEGNASCNTSVGSYSNGAPGTITCTLN